MVETWALEETDVCATGLEDVEVRKAPRPWLPAGDRVEFEDVLVISLPLMTVSHVWCLICFQCRPFTFSFEFPAQESARFCNKREAESKNDWWRRLSSPPCSSSLFQTSMNVRQTLITVTPPRCASTRRVDTPAPALKDTGWWEDNARVSGPSNMPYSDIWWVSGYIH